jgi:hypothetical protein
LARVIAGKGFLARVGKYIQFVFAGVDTNTGAIIYI